MTKLYQKSLWLALYLFFYASSLAQLYWNTNGSSSGWTNANWSSSPSGPFSDNWVSQSSVVFGANSAITYVSGTQVGNISVTGSSTTVNFTSAGSFSTGGNIRSIDIASGCTLNFGGQDVSTSSGTGFIKNGQGTWDLSGQANSYPGGFTLNSGTVIASGNKTFGTGVLTINAGVIQSSSNLNYSISAVNIYGDFELTGTGNDVITSPVSLGSSTRSISNNISSGSRAISGIISGSGSSGLIISGSGSSLFILSGQNTYQGSTTIQGGTLQLNATGGGTLPSGNEVYVNGGLLKVSSNQTLLNLNMSGGGNLSIDSGVTLVVTGVFTSGTGFISNMGTLILGGTTAQGFPGTSTSISSMKNLTISNTSGITLNQDFAFSSGGKLDIPSNAVLNMANKKVSFASGGEINISGLLKTSNANGFCCHTSASLASSNSPSISLTASSEIEFNGDTQIVNSRSDYAHLTLGGTGSKTMNGHIQASGNLNLGSAQLSNGGYNFTLSGSLLGNGVVSGNGKLLMIGDYKSISASTLQHLELNHANGYYLNSTAKLSGSLTLISGCLFLGNFDLILQTGVSVSGITSSRFIVTNGTGSLKRNNLTASVLFPIGASDSTYNPLTLSNSGTGDNFKVRVVNNVLSQGISGTAINSSIVNRTWFIEEDSAGGSNATLSLSWNALDELNYFNRNSCYLSHFSGSWNALSAGTATGSGPYALTHSGITSFSPFSIASGGALPLKLLSFKSQMLEHSILLKWKTAFEINNEGFTIEKSKNGLQFSKLGFIKGKGHSNVISAYEWVDTLPYPGTSLYRLIQNDFDGKSDTIGLILCHYKSDFKEVRVWPNPFSDLIAIKLHNPFEEIQLMDAKGGIILQCEDPKDGLLELWTSELQSGIYFLLLKQRHQTEMIRLIKY